MGMWDIGFIWIVSTTSINMLPTALRAVIMVFASMMKMLACNSFLNKQTNPSILLIYAYEYVLHLVARRFALGLGYRQSSALGISWESHQLQQDHPVPKHDEQFCVLSISE